MVVWVGDLFGGLGESLATQTDSFKNVAGADHPLGPSPAHRRGTVLPWQPWGCGGEEQLLSDLLLGGGFPFLRGQISTVVDSPRLVWISPI